MGHGTWRARPPELRRPRPFQYPLTKRGDAKMKLTTTAMALALAAWAAPAAAQYNQQPPPTPMRIPDNIPTQAGNQKQTSEAPAPKDGNAHPSGKALKAIVDLQKAINASDTANIPAKLAAAQAAASTKDDHYIIGQLQLKAA